MVFSDTFSQGDSFIHRLDPRARIISGAAFCILVALCRTIETPAAALLLAFFLAMTARLPLLGILRRLAPLNFFMLFLWIVLPLSAPGEVLIRIGPLTWTAEGARLAALITLKGNAIVLALAVFLGTMDASVLGHALDHMHAPHKLTHLFLFTYRYIDVLFLEKRRLTEAMRARAFRPGINMHTYRSYGRLVGMLLVRSLERSERIMEAMKCRGFRGHYYLVDHFAARRADYLFGLMFTALIMTLGGLEWRLWIR